MDHIYDGSWNYEDLDSPELMHELAQAYADCAIELCRQMKSEKFDCTFLRGQAVLYLAHHSTELFLKAAIWRKTGTLDTREHQLAALRKTYAGAYPQQRYEIQTHFRRLNGVGEELNEIAPEQPIDQKLRYPVDKQKSPWWGNEMFDALACLDQLSQFRQDMEQIGSMIYKSRNNCMELL